MASGAHDLDAHLQVRTDDQALVATLRVGPRAPAEHIDEKTFCVFLEAGGISARRIDREAVVSLVEEVRTHPGAEHAAVVAKGIAPRDGARQQLCWAPAIAHQIERIDARRQALADQEKPAPQSASSDEPEEAINFYEQSAFIIVQAGEQLASITPPDLGDDGEDVFGNAVPAKKSAEPCSLDPNTLELTRDNKLISLARGKLVYSGATYGIDRTLSIAEDVGFETGNINFPGPVEIGGGVRDRFVVRARGAVLVRKLVEAASIYSDRDIELERGAAGRDTGLLHAAHNLRAGYLEGIRVSCGMDCCVRHEITNCQVRALGMVKVPTGALRGGLVLAARGIEAGVVGSVQETRTELVVGALEELEDLLRQARRHSADTEAVLEAVLARQQMLNIGGKGKLLPQQIEAQMAMEFEISEARRRISELSDAAGRIEENLRDATHPALRVAQAIYGGVIVWLPGFRATFRSEVKGDCNVRMGPSHSPVIDHRGETHPLAKFARVEPDERVASRTLPPNSANADETHPQRGAA